MKAGIILLANLMAVLPLGLLAGPQEGSSRDASTATNHVKPTITMGYRTTARDPVIAAAPDHSGLYFDLYSKAAEMVGADLAVVRAPKKRIMKGMKHGTVDFYPGFSFDAERSQFTYYIVNGLPGGYVGMSHNDLPEITDLKQMKGRVLLVALGAPDWTVGITGVKIMTTPEADLHKVVELLHARKADLYIYNRHQVEYFLKKNEIKDIKLHWGVDKKREPLFLGFSRRSKHITLAPNPAYSETNTLSVSNFPVVIDKKCLAYRFSLALKEMEESGATSTLYDKYFK